MVASFSGLWPKFLYPRSPLPLSLPSDAIRANDDDDGGDPLPRTRANPEPVPENRALVVVTVDGLNSSRQWAPEPHSLVRDIAPPKSAAQHPKSTELNGGRSVPAGHVLGNQKR
uniref:(northern house mosquito) hypothetical protein n=1 Tax=Culex pipiens TaxID=7175 RepID=A0A8D8A9Y4_CULPI